MSEHEEGVNPGHLNIGDEFLAPIWCGKDEGGRYRKVSSIGFGNCDTELLIILSDSTGKRRGHMRAGEHSYWRACEPIKIASNLTIDPRKVQVNDFLRLKSDPSKYYTVIAVRETGVELSEQLDKPNVFCIFLHWDHVMWYDLEGGGKPEAPEDWTPPIMPIDKCVNPLPVIDNTVKELAEAHAENHRLRKLVVAMAERIFAQSDLLSKKAEK